MQASVISGSPRKDSNSLRVARALTRGLQEKGHQCPSPVDFHYADLPMVGRGSLDSQNLTSFQENFIQAMRDSSLILFAVPEYNWITSGEIINAIHQIGNKELSDVFHNRVFAMVGVSAGRGGRRPALEMQTLINKMISFLDKRSVVSPRLLESHETDKNLGPDGESLGNEIYDKTLSSFLDYSLDMAELWFQGR
ncbi:MAG: NAD(P)H-dependent oxidoreductase [Leptospiraceae bacterium]|jgi:chromate reductase